MSKGYSTSFAERLNVGLLVQLGSQTHAKTGEIIFHAPSMDVMRRSGFTTNSTPVQRKASEADLRWGLFCGIKADSFSLAQPFVQRHLIVKSGKLYRE